MADSYRPRTALIYRHISYQCTIYRVGGERAKRPLSCYDAWLPVDAESPGLLVAAGEETRARQLGRFDN